MSGIHSFVDLSMFPCEFCGEPFIADDLVQHQVCRTGYYYVFCVFSTLFSFKIRSTDHYCKTTHRAKSRFSINFYPFWFISRRFFSCLREVISSLIHDCVYQLVSYHEQTSQLVMLCEQVSANQPQNWLGMTIIRPFHLFIS